MLDRGCVKNLYGLAPMASERCMLTGELNCSLSWTPNGGILRQRVEDSCLISTVTSERGFNDLATSFVLQDVPNLQPYVKGMNHIDLEHNA